MEKPAPNLSAELQSAIKQALENATLPPNAPSISQLQRSSVAGLLPAMMPNMMNNATALQLQQMLQQNLPMMLPQQTVSPPVPTKKKAGPGRPKGSGSQAVVAGKQQS
jgi:hypothetical protein